MADQLRRAFGSVRLRTTLAATLVTGVAVLIAAVWLVRSVESSLESQLRDADATCAAEIVGLIEDGVSPEQVSRQTRCDYFQVITQSGEVIASTPGLEHVPLAKYDRITVQEPGQPAIGPLAVTSSKVQGPSGELSVVAASPLQTVQRSVRTVRSGLTLVLPMLVALVGAVAWVLTGRALRPVEAMRTEVEEITATTLHRRVPEPLADDEIGRLATTMNAMLDRLQEAADRQQQFVSDASHELRSPVAAIRTELEVALRTGDRTDWPTTAANLLAEEARLEAIITDLLLLASLDEADAFVGSATLDLSELVAEEASRPRVAGITVDVGAPGKVVVTGKRVQLGRAIGNVLDNATRHAARSVRVAVHERDGRVRVLVDDDGPGVPAADRDRVFERFTRLESSRQRDSGGSGLGLALVRRILERHGGTATIDTSPLGGARLILDLPAPTEMASAIPPMRG